MAFVNKERDTGSLLRLRGKKSLGGFAEGGHELCNAATKGNTTVQGSCGRKISSWIADLKKKIESDYSQRKALKGFGRN